MWKFQVSYGGKIYPLDVEGDVDVRNAEAVKRFVFGAAIQAVLDNQPAPVPPAVTN